MIANNSVILERIGPVVWNLLCESAQGADPGTT